MSNELRHKKKPKNNPTHQNKPTHLAETNTASGDTIRRLRVGQVKVPCLVVATVERNRVQIPGDLNPTHPLTVSVVARVGGGRVVRVGRRDVEVRLSGEQVRETLNSLLNVRRVHHGALARHACAAALGLCSGGSLVELAVVFGVDVAVEADGVSVHAVLRALGDLEKTLGLRGGGGRGADGSGGGEESDDGGEELHDDDFKTLKKVVVSKRSWRLKRIKRVKGRMRGCNGQRWDCLSLASSRTSVVCFYTLDESSS